MKRKSAKARPRSLARELRREQILEAARGVFAEKGYHNASVSDVVGACGVAQGTFYLYFKSKREVFGALLLEFAGLIHSSFFIPGADEVSTPAEVEKRFSRVCKTALSMLRDNEDLARIFLLEAGARDPGFEKEIGDFYDRLTRGAAMNLKLWMDKGLLRRADPLVIANCVVGMVERLARQRLSGNLEGDFEAMVEEVVAFELYGILNKSGKGRRREKTNE